MSEAILFQGVRRQAPDARRGAVGHCVAKKNDYMYVAPLLFFPALSTSNPNARRIAAVSDVVSGVQSSGWLRLRSTATAPRL